MTNFDARTLLSVRADAQLTVAPDLVRISASLTHTAADANTAHDGAAQLLRRLTDRLTALGGLALTADSAKHTLTWSAHSLRVQSDWDYDEQGHHVGDERHRAIVEVAVTVRDFALLAEVQRVLTGEDGLAIDFMNWDADADNPGWAQVRADAIQAALRKGRDYAAALGGSLVAVEHIADAGLLGTAGAEARGGWIAQSAELGARHGGGGETPHLDPVPQTLTATIDARLTATVGPLPTS